MKRLSHVIRPVFDASAAVLVPQTLRSVMAERGLVALPAARLARRS